MNNLGLIFCRIIPEGWRADLQEQVHRWRLEEYSEAQCFWKSLPIILGFCRAILFMIVPKSIDYIKKIDPSFENEEILSSHAEVLTKLENDYRKDHFLNSLLPTRILCIVLFIAYAGFGYLDIYCLPSSYQLVWIFRSLICFNILLVFYLTFHRIRYFPYSQFINGLGSTVGGVGIATMVAISEPSDLAYNTYYVGLIMTIICICLMASLRFFNALLSSVCVVVSYEYVAIFCQSLLSNQYKDNYLIFINNNFFLLGVFIICIFTCNLNERRARTEFLTRYAVTHKFIELYRYLGSMSPTPKNLLDDIYRMRSSRKIFRQFLIQSLFKDNLSYRFPRDLRD